MNSVAPFAPFRQTTRELIDDNDLSIAHDVLPVENEIAMDLDRAFDESRSSR